MPQYEDLTEGQKKLSKDLISEINKGANGNISSIFKGASQEDLLAVLTTPNIIKLPNGRERTLTPLGFAIYSNSSKENIKAILDVAEKDKEVLEKVFVGIDEHDHKKLKGILETLKNQEQDEEQKTKIDGWLEILAKNISSCENLAKRISSCESNEKPLALMIGSVCGVIAALAVGGGLFAAGVALPILALIGIAVATALVIGVIAGGITYSVSKPSDKLDEPYLGANQQVNEVR